MNRDAKTGLYLPERGGLDLRDQRRLFHGLMTDEEYAKLIPPISGGGVGFVDELISAQGDGTAVANSAAATSLLTGAMSQAKKTIAANYLSRIGQMIRIHAFGRISCIVTTPGTLTIELRLGPTANIVVFTTGAFNLNVVAKTNVSWQLDIWLKLRAVGITTSANFMGHAEFQSEAVVGAPTAAAGGNGSLILPVSAPAVGTGFDSTVANLMDLYSTFSVANAGNSIQAHDYHAEAKN
jgi:hypothetical protein